VNFEVSSCTKFQIFQGFALDPAGGAYSTPPGPLAGGEGLAAPSPRIPPQLLLALWALALWAEASSPSVREKIAPPQNKFGLHDASDFSSLH